MDAVLGLSMTPTTVGLVLVEGQEADGATMDKDEFAVHDRGLVSAVNTSEKAAAAVMRTEAIAAARGHRLHSIGVTWSEDADTEASLLLESLSESGFDNVVAVRLARSHRSACPRDRRRHRLRDHRRVRHRARRVVVLVVDTARWRRADGGQPCRHHRRGPGPLVERHLRPGRMATRGAGAGRFGQRPATRSHRISKTCWRCPCSCPPRLSWRSPAAPPSRRRTGPTFFLDESGTTRSRAHHASTSPRCFRASAPPAPCWVSAW